MFGVVSALLSALGAVYTEWVLKKNNDTLYWQNTLLYGFGALFNGINLYHRFTVGRGPARTGEQPAGAALRGSGVQPMQGGAPACCQ